MNKVKFIKYPYEYFAAQLEFGLTIAKILKKNRKDVLKKYTDVYGALTDHSYADIQGNEWVGEIIKKFENILTSSKDWEKIKTDSYDLFLSTDHKYENVPSDYANEPLRFGCFKLNYSEYYKNQKVIRLHFSPLRNGLLEKDCNLKTSDLSPIYMEDRKNEFSQMIQYIYDNPKEFIGASHFYSSTWLQNLDAYKSFFPRTQRRIKTDVFYWLWGQFIKWDYSGNDYRYKEFKSQLQKARTVKDAINAIPYKIYEVRVPLKKMFMHYGLQVPQLAEVAIEPNLEPTFLPLGFLSNPLLSTHIAYQSEE